jgi:Holliday junction resolvase RusA-like endonuclease
MKSAYDGLVDAGILEDDSGVIHLPIEVGYDRARPRVEIVVSPVSPRRVGEADRA